MDLLKNMKIGTRLALGFGATVVLGAGIAVYATTQMRAMAQHLNEVANSHMVKVGQFTEVMNNLNAIGRYARNILINPDPAFRQAELKKIADVRAENTRLLAELDKSLTRPNSREIFKIIQDTRGPYNQAMDRALELAQQGKAQEAGAQLFGEVRTKQNALFQAVLDSNKLEKDLADEIARKAAQSAARDSIALLALAGMIALIGTLVAWLVTRSIAAPLREAIEVAGRIKDGDLTREVEVTAADETGQLLAAIRDMQVALRSVVGQVRTGVDSVSTASGQIAAGNQDLSSRTEEQASSLQQTAASMEQLTSTVKQSADNAKQANQLAVSASEAASKGGAVVGQVVATMEDITASSKKIADIISVIDGIAFQTNILALNAAVEAARAGEQGRGFAVVAGEVRNLAQRSAQAAREIKSLISDSVEKVEAGSRQVNDAGSAMSEIVAQVKRVTDLIGEITSASLEQSSGIGQVNDAITQMDQATQQNAALVEESAAAAASLKEQAGKLAEAVAVFKLAQGETRQVIAKAQVAAKQVQAKPAATRKPVAPAAKPEPKKSPAEDSWQEF